MAYATDEVSVKITIDKEWVESMAAEEDQFGVPMARRPLNPGIRNTVALLNHLGYITTDSGDGETRDFECDREVGYVVILVPPTKELVTATDEVAQILIERGLKLGYYMPEEERFETQIQGSYCPYDGLSLIDIMNITDEMLGLTDEVLADLTRPPQDTLNELTRLGQEMGDYDLKYEEGNE